MSPTDMRGERLPNGSWKTICMRARSRRSDALVERGEIAALEADHALRVLRGEGSANPIVDLPEPHLADQPTVSPARTATDTPSTARTWPTVAPQEAAPDREMDAHILRLDELRAASVGSGGGRALRLGGEQHPRVGMRGAREHLGDAARLDDRARPSSRRRGRRSGGRSRGRG